MDTISSLTASLKAEPTGLLEVKEELRKGKSSLLTWIYGTVDTGTVIFNATYEQAPTGTYVLSTVGITCPHGEGGD